MQALVGVVIGPGVETFIVNNIHFTVKTHQFLTEPLEEFMTSQTHTRHLQINGGREEEDEDECDNDISHI